MLENGFTSPTTKQKSVLAIRGPHPNSDNRQRETCSVIIVENQVILETVVENFIENQLIEDYKLS